ncbi:hypothetical protein BDR26DRAFT_914551 [Obelidium mucronatum]|nr:hypothetical protein BDR26DRAFT_914551 [Obelidium mucronatum]
MPLLECVANGLAVFEKENIKPGLLPHFEGLQPLVAYLTGVVESLVHREAFEMVANITKEVATTCDPIFGIFTSSFLACSNSRDFKFHLDSKNSTFGINFSVVVDEEDAEPPVVWPAPNLPDRNVVIPAEHGEAIVSMSKHEKHGTRMWHSGERRFVEAAELAAEADTRKRRISLILADGMGTASLAVKRNQDRFMGSAVVEKWGVTFNINRDATDRNRWFCKHWVEQCGLVNRLQAACERLATRPVSGLARSGPHPQLFQWQTEGTLCWTPQNSRQQHQSSATTERTRKPIHHLLGGMGE